jgi:dTDP-glucose pyrophosphorylase
MKQTIVITMAGRGSRFRDVGYMQPKYEIVAHGRSLFRWSMDSLKNFLSDRSRVVFVCLAQNDSAAYVKQECRAMGLEDFHVFELDEVTDGQATSAYASRHLWLPDAPVLVYNIDTYVHPDFLHPQSIDAAADGWIPCFRALGDHWSFVDAGADGWAVDVVEKTRVSENASIGLYWFARGSDYVTTYESFFADPSNAVRGERYIAPMYRQLIGQGARVSIADLPLSAVHVLGTPRELEVFLAKDRNEIA